MSARRRAVRPSSFSRSSSASFELCELVLALTLSIPLEKSAEIRFDDFDAPRTDRLRPTSPSSTELRRLIDAAVDAVIEGAREEVRG